MPAYDEALAPPVSERTRIPIDRQITLHSLARRDVPARALAITGDDGEVRVVLELAPETWAAALELGWFNLAPGDRDGRIAPGRKVEVECALRADVAAGAAVAAIAYALAAGDPASPYTCTESWRALNVVQRVPLPDGVTGVLRSGFQTVWAESQAGEVAAPLPIDVIARVARRHGLVLDHLGDGLYRAATPRWPVLIRLDDDRCAVYSVHPRRVPPARRGAAAAWCVQQNYDLTVGGFELDLEDGEVRFRTSLDTGGEPLTDALFDRLLVANLVVMDARFDEIG